MVAVDAHPSGSGAVCTRLWVPSDVFANGVVSWPSTPKPPCQRASQGNRIPFLRMALAPKDSTCLFETPDVGPRASLLAAALISFCT